MSSPPWRNVMRLSYMSYWFFKNSISNTKFAMPGMGQGFSGKMHDSVRTLKFEILISKC
jgi:hypothetical protein